MEWDNEATYVDLMAQATATPVGRIAWSHQSQDLNVNLIRLNEGEEIGEHRNREVDVLFTGIAGSGTIEVSGFDYILQPGWALLIPKGAPRRIRCTEDRFVYLTCHRPRAGLWPTSGGAESLDLSDGE